MSVSTSVVSDAINNRKTKKKKTKVKVRHEEEDEEEKESNWEDNHSYDNDKNNQCGLLTKGLCHSILSECKSLEEYIFSLEIRNDKTRCFEIMSQCYLALEMNEKEVASERHRCGCDELVVKCNKKVKEMQCAGKTCNGFFVKHRKLIDDHSEAIMVNDMPKD